MKRSTMWIAFVALALASPAAAQDFPPRKPGLWLTTMTPPLPMMAGDMKSCIDAASDAAMMRMGAQGDCSAPKMGRSGAAYTLDASCRLDDMETKTHMVSRFDGDTRVHTETSMTFDPPIPGMPNRPQVSDSRWVSACPSDMKPGDVVMPNGMKMNALTGK